MWQRCKKNLIQLDSTSHWALKILDFRCNTLLIQKNERMHSNSVQVLTVGPHLRRWLVAQPSSKVPSWGFPGFSLSDRYMPGDLCTAPGIFSLSPLSLSDRRDRRDWRDTRSKWPLARNPDRSWWHYHISVKPFWPQPISPRTQKKVKQPTS